MYSVSCFHALLHSFSIPSRSFHLLEPLAFLSGTPKHSCGWEPFYYSAISSGWQRKEKRCKSPTEKEENSHTLWWLEDETFYVFPFCLSLCPFWLMNMIRNRHRLSEHEWIRQLKLPMMHCIVGAVQSAAALIGAYRNNKSWKMTEYVWKKSMATPETLLPQGYHASCKGHQSISFWLCSGYKFQLRRTEAQTIERRMDGMGVKMNK